MGKPLYEFLHIISGVFLIYLIKSSEFLYKCSLFKEIILLSQSWCLEMLVRYKTKAYNFECNIVKKIRSIAVRN